MSLRSLGFLDRLWLIPLAVVLLLMGCQTRDIEPQTSQLILSKAWRIGTDDQATLQDAQNATDWSPLPEWKSWGFGRETIWVRLQLRAVPQEARTHWVVRVRPAFLDYLTLYDPATGLVLHTGDALPPDNDGLTSINFTLHIPSMPEERTVYLQLRTTSARTLNVEVLPYGQAQQLNRLQEWLMGFVIALSAIFAVWAFIQWWVTRDKFMGAFAIKQALASVWAFLILGFARVLLGPSLDEGVLTSTASMVFIGTVCVTLWFFSMLINGYQAAPFTLHAIRMLAASIAILPVLHWMGHTTMMLSLANHGILLGFALMWLALLSAVPQRVKQPIPLAVLLVYMLIYSTLNSIPSLIHIGWIEAQSIVLYGGLAHAVLDGIVMFILLQIRAGSLRKERVKIDQNLQHTQQTAESEKRQREEQSQLFAMLAHEIKTPLATLRMWMEAGQLKPETMERAIADMNQVIERCVHTGQLADQGLRALPQAFDAELLTRNCIDSCRNPARVSLNAPKLGGALHSDAQMLSIVLGNLLDNACKYGAANKPIQVTLQSARQDGRSGWLWKIENSVGAAGFPDADRLFEKYYRSPQARRLSGSGLGLFLVKGLLDLMRGSIHYKVESDSLEFSIWLPENL
jgi:signal transduction histidine kinase